MEKMSPKPEKKSGTKFVVLQIIFFKDTFAILQSLQVFRQLVHYSRHRQSIYLFLIFIWLAGGLVLKCRHGYFHEYTNPDPNHCLYFIVTVHSVLGAVQR